MGADRIHLAQVRKQWRAPVKMITLKVLQETDTLQMDNKLLREDCASVVNVQFKFPQKFLRIYASEVFRLSFNDVSKYPAHLNIKKNSIRKQDMQCTYCLTLRSVRVSKLQWESRK